jgi:hypothetical protein
MGASKGVKMFRKANAAVTVVGLALAVLASATQAETVELTDVQMDQITAGAFAIAASTNNLVDINNNFYIFNPVTSTFTDTQNIVWTPAPMYWYHANGLAMGLLVGPQGQLWDGGYYSLSGPLVNYTLSAGI